MFFRTASLLMTLLALACSASGFKNTDSSKVAKVQSSHVETKEIWNSVFVYGAGDETLFPDLRNFCNQDSSWYAYPYNTVLGRTPIWGYLYKSIQGCGSSTLSSEGEFADITDGSQDPSLRAECKGTMILTQTGEKMTVTWKDIEPYDFEQPCPQAGHKVYTLELKRKNLEDVKSPYLSWYEFHLALHEGFNMNEVFGLEVVAANGSPALGAHENKFKFNFGTILQTTLYCDRGGADFPHAGVCYKFRKDGQPWGTVFDVSEPKPERIRTITRMKRSDFRLVRLK